MSADKPPMYLQQCVSRTRVELVFWLRNNAMLRLRTPWADAFSAGVSVLTPAHACTLLLQQGTQLIKSIGNKQFKGGMYSIDGAVTDVMNEIRTVRVFCYTVFPDARRGRCWASAKIPSHSYTLELAQNSMLTCLRRATDSLGGGEYLDETPVTESP